MARKVLFYCIQFFSRQVEVCLHCLDHLVVQQVSLVNVIVILSHGSAQIVLGWLHQLLLHEALRLTRFAVLLLFNYLSDILAF